MKYLIAFTAILSLSVIATKTHDISDKCHVSRISGTFNGWDGDTIVQLTNGQVWQQIEYRYDYHYAYMPNAVIYQSSEGLKMCVDGVARCILVRRLK